MIRRCRLCTAEMTLQLVKDEQGKQIVEYECPDCGRICDSKGNVIVEGHVESEEG